MSLLTRYLTREFARLFALCLAGGTLLYALIDVFDRIERFLRHGASVKWILLFLAYKVPLIVYQILPAAMLLAVLLTIGLMSRNNEVLALRTSGVPIWRISYPFVAISLAVSLISFLFSEYVVPATFQRSEYIRHVLLEGQTPTGLRVRNRIWFKGQEGIYRIASFLPTKKEIQGISLFVTGRPYHLERRLDASRATWQGDHWLFYDVEERVFRDGLLVKTTRTAERRVDLPERPEDFMALQREAEDMPFHRLRAYIEKIRSEGYDPTPYRVELHKKIAFPILNAITVFLGLPFALRLPRYGGLAAAIGISLILGFFYWVVFAILVSIGQAGLIPPLMAAWSANILFAVLGIYLLLRVEERAIR